MPTTDSPHAPIVLDQDKRLILSEYRKLMQSCQSFASKGDKKLIREAFELAIDAHKDMRRKSGEPYILHPIAVAQIVVDDIGLGTTSIISALLHDVVEDTEITLAELETLFGKTVSKIVSGLTKISGLYNKNTAVSLQAENFRKMLLTLADDIRVIIIKLADRLHNMRTLDAHSPEKQLRIAYETQYLYVPLAHRLGLYNIKSELEDLCLKYIEPEVYTTIAKKLRQTLASRNAFIDDFIVPIRASLLKNNLKFEIKGRPKSISSIYGKMKKQGIEFEEVYDLFAIRVIIDCPPELEKAQSWLTYSCVTDTYFPDTKRLRDWITIPKSNGYESLHITVMGQKGRYVEVQIRTKRMDEIAEKGLAAHWRYKSKESISENAFDQWLAKVRETLSNPEPNATEYVEDFRLDLYSSEIFVFTPKGDLRKLPAGATALDYAFDIHSDLGMSCIGAKVNYKIVGINHVLQNGDQVEVITSKNQKPKTDWLGFVVTSKAKTRIKSALKEQEKADAEHGKETLQRKFRTWKIDFNDENVSKSMAHFKFKSALDFYQDVATEKIDLKLIKDFLLHPEKYEPKEQPINNNANALVHTNENNFSTLEYNKDELLIIDDKQLKDILYSLAGCCKPIPGDRIFAFVTTGEGIKIHRSNCPNAMNLHIKQGGRIIKARWATEGNTNGYLAGILIAGIDDTGIISGISRVISDDLNLNIQSINIQSDNGVFEGRIMLFVKDSTHLDILIQRMKNVNGVLSVNRFEANEPSN